MNRTSYDFLDVLKGTIDDKVSTLDQTIYCKIVGVNEDYTLDVTIVPDEHTRVRNVVNASKYEFKMGDYGILYKIGNNLANAFIIAKLGPSYADNQPLSKQVADENETTVQTFSANQSGNVTANITVPTKVSELENDSGFTSNAGTVTSVAVKMNGEEKGKVTSSGTIDLGTVLTNDGGTINKSKTIKMDASANSDGANLKWGTVNHKNPYIGYASDQVDGTFVVGSLLGTNYASGLAIGGGSGNLLWKGTKVATTSDITAHSNIVATQTTLGHIKMYVEGDTLYLNT